MLFAYETSRLSRSGTDVFKTFSFNFRFPKNVVGRTKLMWGRLFLLSQRLFLQGKAGDKFDGLIFLNVLNICFGGFVKVNL